MSDRIRLDAMAAAAAEDPEFAHVARWSRYAIVAETPHASVRIVVLDGAVSLSDAPHDLETLKLRAPVSTWRELASRSAPPRRHDLLALTKAEDGIEIIAGTATLIRHLRSINRLVEIGREHA